MLSVDGPLLAKAAVKLAQWGAWGDISWEGAGGTGGSVEQNLHRALRASPASVLPQGVTCLCAATVPAL